MNEIRERAVPEVSALLDARVQQWLNAERAGDHAVLDQRAAYQGRPNDGSFRVSQTWVDTGSDWLLAGVHFSPIAAPPGRPGVQSGAGR